MPFFQDLYRHSLDLSDRTPTAPVALFPLEVEEASRAAELLDDPAALRVRLEALGIVRSKP